MNQKEKSTSKKDLPFTVIAVTFRPALQSTLYNHSIYIYMVYISNSASVLLCYFIN